MDINKFHSASIKDEMMKMKMINRGVSRFSDSVYFCLQNIKKYRKEK